MSVLVALTDQSPWPYMADEPCSGSVPEHASRWVVWTRQDTGDGMRFACDDDLAGWVMAVWERIDGWVEDPEL